MNKKIKLFIIILLGFIFLPNNVKAISYNTLNLKQTLADEEITEKFKNYKETSDAITIYMFRGKGCGYCRAFLEFLNSITSEYGKYYKLVSYEVWNDTNNNKLMGEVSSFLGQSAGGVPYIIIGDKVFSGYAEDYNDSIKQAITDLYKTKKNKRYDVFTEMKKNSNNNNSYSTNAIIFSLIYTVISTIIIITYINLKFKELKVEINNLNNKKNYKESKK